MEENEPGIIYSLVSKGSVVLVEHSNREGNFVTLAKRILTSVQPADHKRSFFDKSGRFVFHYQVNNGLTFMCFATKEHKTSVCFAYLDSIQKSFYATFEQSEIDGALAYQDSFQGFARTLEQEMARYGRMQYADSKVAEVQGKVDETKNVMRDNISKIVERGENIETLIEKTDILVARSDSFAVNSNTLKKKLWWKNAKLWVLLVVICIVLAWLIASSICGFDFSKCGTNAT